MKKLHKYLKKEKMPTALCPGCGHGILMGAVLKAISELELNAQDIVFVSDNGCIGLAADSLDLDVVHTADGQSIPVALGIKKANPGLNVIVLTGDGALSTTGMSHLIHAAAKNVELAVVCATNNVYAMAGGFACPTTPVGAITQTTPAGNTHLPIDLCKAAYAGGAQYIARTSVYHSKQLVKSIRFAMLSKGFGFVETLSICPVEFGARNSFKTPMEMLNYLRLNCVPSDIITSANQRGLTDRVIIGEFTRR